MDNFVVTVWKSRKSFGNLVDNSRVCGQVAAVFLTKTRLPVDKSYGDKTYLEIVRNEVYVDMDVNTE